MEHQGKAPEGNLTKLMELFLLGFADAPHLQKCLFGLFLLIYIIILMGNGIIFLITKLDPGLQTPVYFFLGTFSLLEICYVSVTLPRMLTSLGTQRTISLVACAAQMRFVLTLGAPECFLLAVMACDRYAAICSPLRYPLVMNPQVCVQLAAGSWISGVPTQIGQTCQIFSLPSCGSSLINHFSCDTPPILKLACGDTFLNEVSVFTVAALFVLVPFLLILVSYGRIISTILKLPSATSRGEAFSTCSSRLMAVALFFESGLVAYLRAKTQGSAGTDRVLSLFYTIVTPVFNPMMYSLRNKDAMMALRKRPEDNVSTVIQFVLLGFSDLPNLQGLLLGVFSIIYIINLTGNSLLIIITCLDPALHKSIYFSLANFSSLEICYVSVTLPRILVNLWTQDGSISVLACAAQMCFFLILGTTECFFLAVMACDRCVAICNPLHYPLVMTPKTCLQLAVGSWASGIPVQIGQTCWIFTLRFCHSNQINHFFCDVPPILKLACGHTFAHELSVYVAVLLVAAVPFMLILASYSKIICTILRLPTARRDKAFSTCSSHLLAVLLFFVSAAIAYLRPKSIHSAGSDRLLSLFNTVVTPVLNPMIYSLLNKDEIAALRQLLLKI